MKMRSINRILAIVLALVLAAGLAACAGNASKKSEYKGIKTDSPEWVANLDAAATAAALRSAHQVLSTAAWTHEGLEQALRARAEADGLKAGQLFQPIRVAVTGRRESPGLFETLYHVGRERALARIARAEQILAAPAAP